MVQGDVTLPQGSPHPDGLPRRGDRLGPFRIHSEIGRGSLGVVFRARDERHDRWVAVKVARPDAAYGEEELRAEARLATAFHHRNIVHAYETGECEGRLYLALELLDGEDLASLIDREGALPLPRTLELARDIACGLVVLHRRGIVHRDLKASNIRVTAEGRAKILDLGTPSAANRRLPGGRYEYFGTPEYSAPEQCACDERRIGPATDLYAFGILLYEMLAGRPPFCDRRTTRVLRMQVHDRPPPIATFCPAVPDRLVDLLARLLEKDPTARPQRAALAVVEIDRLRALMRAKANPNP